MTHILGVDVSKYDAGWNPGGATQTINFVIQRAGYGQTKDERFDEILPETMKIPVRGFYWYFSSHVNWKIQADKFLSVVSGKTYHFLAVDYEGAFNSLDARTVAELAEMVKYLKEKTTKRVLVYFSPSIYFEKIRDFRYANWARQQEIWLAQYPPVSKLNLDAMPQLDGLNIVLWQFGGGDVNGTYGRTAGAEFGAVRTGIDVNIAKFDNVTDFQSWAGASGESVPPVVIPPVSVPEPSGLYTFDKNNYYFRPGGGPLTLPMSRSLSLGDNMNPISWAEWRPFFVGLGNTQLALDKICAKDVGPSKGIDSATGKLKYIGLLWPGRNIVKINEVVEGTGGEKWGKVEYIRDNAVPNTYLVNRFDTPHLVHLMYGFSQSAGYYNIQYSCYLPILGDYQWYVQMYKMVSVDAQLPKIVTCKAFPFLNERENATVLSKSIKAYLYNAKIKIVSVRIGKGGIWGKTENGGYIALRHMDKNLTDWII